MDLQRQQEIVEVYLSGTLATCEIAEKFNISPSSIYNILKKFNVPRRSIKEGIQIAKRNGRGGNPAKQRRIKHGYVLVKTEEGEKAEHIHVAEQVLGRKLKRNEVVHHIDLDKTNNHPSNLIVLSNEVHSKLHGINLNNVIREAIVRGYIVFDRERIEYRWKE